jgi:hypothetical protein
VQGKLEYLTRLSLSEENRGSHTISFTNVVFSNDGFFYRPSDELQRKRVAVHRHGSRTWAQLEVGVYRRALSSIMQWGAEYMVQPCEVQIFYNSDVELIDVCFKLQNEAATVSRRLSITFEPGFPIADADVEELWDKL